MVAGSRCSGRASTKAIITTVRTASDCLSSSQSSIESYRLHLHHPRLGGGRGFQILAPEEVDDDRLHRHDDHDHRREVIDEIVEGQPDLRADQDVGRVADQRGGAADIGGEDFREQIRVGRHFQRLADRQRDRNDQQHRGDVVEEGRQHRGGDLQDEQDAGGMRLGRLRRPDGEILEHAGAARDRHQDHHAGQQADGVPVDALDRLVLIEHADQDHHAGADQRDDRAVDLLRHDGGVGDGQDAGRHPHRIEAEINVRCRVRGHCRAPQNLMGTRPRGRLHPCTPAGNSGNGGRESRSVRVHIPGAAQRERLRTVRCRPGIVPIPNLERPRLGGAPLRAAPRPGHEAQKYRHQT